MSANSALVNAHINRVIDEGGDVATINQAWLQAAYQWLVDEGLEKDLLHWADPAFGVLKSGSDITRIYDLGSTYLPRSLDLTSRDSTKTTYDATGVGGFPAFVNADGSSHLYWGRNKRYNPIRRKQQLTIAAMYSRSQTASNICFVGVPTSTSTSWTFEGTPQCQGPLIPGISLVHTSGTPGTISFSLSDKTYASTSATVTASGAATQVAVGTYDGTTMYAYSDGTGGSGNTGLQKDPYFASDTALAGARGGGILPAPVLTIGDTKASAVWPNPNTPTFAGPSLPFTYTNDYAQFKGGSIIVLGKALTPTQVTSLTSLLLTHGSTTVDIKTDYGAVGDGQIMTTNCTIPTAGNNKRLTTAATRFVVGDVGKRIAITGAVPVTSVNPLGALLTTIDTFNSTSDVVLHDATTNTLTASSQQVEWGTDDWGAFDAFMGVFAGQSNIELTIPTGRYLIIGPPGNPSLGFSFGVTGLTVTGAGKTLSIISDMLATGAGLWYGGAIGALDGNSGLTDTVSAGDSSLTLINPGDAAFFSAGAWGLMTGLDVQGFGSPGNWQFHEWVYITNVSGSTITLQSPLVHTYKSTWPDWGTGSNGPAALCALLPDWDCDHEYIGLQIISTYSVNNCNGKNITWTDCHFLIYGPNASTVKEFVMVNTDVDAHGGSWEIDKALGNVSITGGLFHSVQFQSAAVSGTFTMTGSTVDTQLAGTGLNTVLDTVTVANGLGVGLGGVYIGPGAYGSAQTFSATDCVIGGDGLYFSGVGETGVSNYCTMAGGVISFLNDVTIVTNATTAAGNAVLHFAPGVIPTDVFAGMVVRDVTTPGAIPSVPSRPGIQSFDATSITMDANAIGPGVGSGDLIRFSWGTPPQWCVPGATCFWKSGGIYTSFQITDMTDDGTRIHMPTSLAGTFPTLPATPPYGIQTHAAPSFIATNCTGSRDAVAYSGFAAHPLGSKWRYTYASDIGTTQAVVRTIGQIVSVTFTINSTFATGTLNLDSPFVLLMTTGITSQWLPVVDLTRGPRTITVTPSGVTSTPVGIGGADANLTLPGDGQIWLYKSQITPKMSGATVPGSITLEFNLDQGIVAATDPTTTAVVSSGSPAAFGSSVTFTATVSHASGVSTPTGLVTFYDAATPIGSNSLNGSAQAAVSTSLLGSGSHSITAVYAGDANYSGSTSPAIIQVITGSAGGLVVFTTMM